MALSMASSDQIWSPITAEDTQAVLLVDNFFLFFSFLSPPFFFFAREWDGKPKGIMFRD